MACSTNKIDTDELIGDFLDYKVRPGLSLGGLDITFKRDTEIETYNKAALFCGISTSPHQQQLALDNHPYTSLRAHSPFLVRLHDGTRSRGLHKKGHSSRGLACRLEFEALAALAERYRDLSILDMAKNCNDISSIVALPKSARCLNLANMIWESPYSEGLQEMFLEGCFINFLADLCHLYSERHDRHRNSGLSTREIDRAHMVRQMLEDDLENPPSLDTLCAAAGVNPTTLSRQFKIVFGTTIFTSLREIRLTEARQLLQSGSHSVSQVAYKVGYNSPAAFATAYRAQFGYPPSNDQL